MSRSIYLDQLLAFKRTKAYENFHRESIKKVSSVLNELHDALFAAELHRIVPRYRGFLNAERHAKWADNGQRGWDRIRKMENRRIDFLFDINRKLLDDGSSLLKRVTDIAQAQQISLQRALQQAQQLEAELITVERPERGYLQDFLEFYLNGPENYEPALPPSRDIDADTEAPTGQAERRIVAQAEGAARISSLRRKMFDDRGVAVVRGDGQYLVQEIGEGIKIRCLGQSDGNGPFYQESQYDNALSCSAHATGSFLNPSCDIDSLPVALSLKEYRAEAAQTRLDVQGGPLDGLPDNHRDFAAVVLRRMDALHKPVTFELLYHLTSRQATHLTLAGLSVRNPPSALPAAQIAQIRTYFDLIGFADQGLQFFKGGLWRDSPDWPFLQEMIDGQANSSRRMIICYTSNVEFGLGHFVAIHRKKKNRKWVLVDSTRFDQPGLYESRVEWKPSDYLLKDVMRRVDAFELIMPRKLDASLDEEIVHNGFFEHYNTVLSAVWFSDAVDALSVFCQHKVSKILLDEHRHARPDGHDDERDGPVFNYANVERIDLLAIGAFLDASARLPTEAAQTEVTEVTVNIWQSLAQFMRVLDDLHEKQQVDRIMLGGWETAPYFVAAAYDTLNLEDEPQWRIVQGTYQDQTLEAFFPQLIASLPLGVNLDCVEVLSWQAPYYSAENQVNMGTRVSQWSTARMHWMLASVRNGEQQARNRLTVEQEQEQERERARVRAASAASQIHGIELDADAEHDSDLDSLFGENTHSVEVVRTSLTFPQRPNELGPAFGADFQSVPVLHAARPALEAVRTPSRFYQGNLENLIAGRPSDPYPFSYQPKAPRPIAHARIFRQHVDPSRIGFRKGGMLNFLKRADVRLEIDPRNAESICGRFRVEAETDQRYAKLSAGQDLIDALNAYVQDVRLGHLADDHQDEFNSQVRFFWARSGMHDLTHEDGQSREVLLPLLVQMRAHDIGKPQKRVEITDMRPATRPNLITMILGRGARQWQFRPLTLNPQTAGLALERLRSDCMRRINGAPPEDLLESLEEPEAFLDKIQHALRRDDDEAAEVITARLWRVTVQLGEFNVRLLLTKRQNFLQDIHLDIRENRLVILEQINNDDERRKGFVSRLMDAPDQVLERFFLHLNNNSGGLLYSYFDALAAIERQKELDQLDELPEDYAPLQQLVIETPGGDRLAMLVLFEAGEAVALREDIDEASERIRRDMLRLPVDAALAAHLERLMAHVESDGDSDGEANDAADAAEKEMVNLVNALVFYAQALPDDEDIPGIADAPVNIDKVLEVLQKGVRHGTGEIVDADYPDLKRYQLALKDSSGAVKRLAVLIRLKDIDHPEDEDRIREIRPDTEAGLARMLAYPLPKKDLDKIRAYDRAQNWFDTGHGPLRELAETDYRRQHPDDEDIDFSRLKDPTEDFILKIVRRNAQGAIPIPGFPDIARYPTPFYDDAGHVIYLIARVSHSLIRAVRLDTPAEFMSIALHKSDPGDYLQSVRARLPPHMSADELQALLQPANEDRASIPADYTAYSHFSYAPPGQEDDLQAPQFVGRIEGRQITELAPAERFGELAAYKVPVMFMRPIRAFDKRNGRFIQKHLPPGQTLWEFVTQHVRRDNKQPLPGFHQLGRYPVAVVNGNNFALVARVESGEIWAIGEYNQVDHRVLRRMEKQIERDLRAEPRRAVWYEEKKLRSRRALDVAIDRVNRRQRKLQDPQAVNRMKEQAKAIIIQKAAKRDVRAEMLRLSLPQEIRLRQASNMTALFEGEDLVSAITDLLNEEGWEQVTRHADQEILRKTNGRRDEAGELLYLYVFMRKDRLRDVRVGNADELQTLINRRRNEMGTIAGTDIPYLPLSVVHEVWSLDRYSGHGLLIEFADRAQKSFPDWLRATISQPDMVNGRPVFKDGAPVLDRAGHPIEWLRRYPVGPVANGGAWHLIGEFDADRDLADPKVQIRLADAYIEPPDEGEAAYVLSPALRALWNYLLTGAVAPVSLPRAFEAAAVATRGEQSAFMSASPVRPSEGGSRASTMQRDRSMSQASATQAEQQDAKLRRGESLLRELETGPPPQRDFLNEFDFDALFAAMNEDEDLAEMNLFNEAAGFQANPSWNLPGSGDVMRQSVDRMLADAGIDRRSPGVDSTASSYSPMIYALHRIEYQNEDVIERVMEDLYDTHGAGVHSQLMSALSPDSDIRHVEDRFWYWLLQVAQPDREKMVNPKHPELKAFSLGLLGDQGEPVCFLATVRNGLVGRPWVDNPKNEKELIKKLEDGLDEKKWAFTEAAKPKTALSRNAADAVVSQLKLSDARLFQLQSSLAAQALGSELLRKIHKEECRKYPHLVNAKKIEVFRSFLTRGFRDALMQPRSNARLLTIPTGMREIEGSTLNIVATLRGNSVAELWAASTAKRQRRLPVDQVRQQMEQEELIDDVPYIKTEKALRRRQRNVLGEGIKGAGAKTYARKSVKFEDVVSVSGKSRAIDTNAASTVLDAASDRHGVGGGSTVSRISARSVKRGIDALLIDEPESSVKRRRTLEADETMDSMDMSHSDGSVGPGSPMFIDNDHDAVADHKDDLASVLPVLKQQESDGDAGTPELSLFVSDASEDVDSPGPTLHDADLPEEPFHLTTFSDSSAEEEEVQAPTPQLTQKKSLASQEKAVAPAPYRSRLRRRIARTIVEDSSEPEQDDLRADLTPRGVRLASADSIAPTASAILPGSVNLPGLGAIRLAPLRMPLSLTERAVLDAVLRLDNFDGLVTTEEDGRSTHTFEGRLADGSRIPVTLVLDDAGTLRRMTLYAESDATAGNPRLDVYFGVPPTDSEWLAPRRLPLTQPQRARATRLVAHLKQYGVPLAQLELDAPWPTGPSDACLRELLWSMGTRHGDTLQALAAQYGLTLARLNAAPRDTLMALLSGLAGAQKCLPLGLSELRLFPPRLSAPCIAQTSAVPQTQSYLRAVLGLVLRHSKASECGATGIWGQAYTAGADNIRGMYLPRDRFASALLRAYRQIDPAPGSKQLSCAQALLARLDERVSPVDSSLLRHWGKGTLSFDSTQLVALGMSTGGTLNFLRGTTGFLTWLAANAAAHSQAYDLDTPGGLSLAPTAPTARAMIQIAQPLVQPSNPVLRATFQIGLGRLSEAANAAPESGPGLSLMTWNGRAIAYASFLLQLERQHFTFTLPAGLSLAAQTHTLSLLAAHATAASESLGDPETLTGFLQLPGALLIAIVAPLARHDRRLRSALNCLHGLDLFGTHVPPTYVPRLLGHCQILQLCEEQGISTKSMRELRGLLHYVEQRWARGGGSRVIQALTAQSFKAFKIQLASYPGQVTHMKTIYDVCHTVSFSSDTEPHLVRNARRLAQLETLLAEMPTAQRKAARAIVVRWLRQEEGKMPNTSYDRVGQALELADANAFCDTVAAQLKVTLTSAQRSAFTALHEQTPPDDFIDSGAEE